VSLAKNAETAANASGLISVIEIIPAAGANPKLKPSGTKEMLSEDQRVETKS
jgi:hypothetical protein